MSTTYTFENCTPQLPQNLQEKIKTRLSNWLHLLDQSNQDGTLPAEILQTLPKIWCCSDFIADSCEKNLFLLPDLVRSTDLLQTYNQDTYVRKLHAYAITDEAGLKSCLRQFRRREMVRIAWRDLAGWAEVDETLSDLSYLAETCIQFALDFLYRHACELRGTPQLSDGTPQTIVVLGMGKLGGVELNYSSDIDLIFAYQEEGELNDSRKTSYSEFFTRLCQKLVQTLSDITEEGFVFRTDIRLRPFGDSGPVIMTFTGMENYYLTQAREWERYAMIKARPVAGDFIAGEQLMSMLKPFVYRRYLDYGAFEELRNLKVQITQELKRKDRLENVKLGPGGIREIEFIGQAFQLIRGGKDKALQTRSIIEALHVISELGHLSVDTVQQLLAAYRFLRRVENHIQEYQDQQTHDLPNNEDAKIALALSLNYPDWDSFKLELDTVRHFVHDIFDQVFSVSKQNNDKSNGDKIWAYTDTEDTLINQLSNLGYVNGSETLVFIKAFKTSSTLRKMTSKGALIIDKLIPQVIEAAPQYDNPDETLKRLLTLFEAVAGRNVYLALLAENPDALKQLIKLSSASAWLTDYLAQYPILFDELLDTRRLYEPLQRTSLDNELANLLAPIDCQDIEQIMITLRQFKHLNVLRIAAADIMGIIPLMVVSDYLTYLAESIVNAVVNRTWLILTDKHGLPPGTSNDHINFAIAGFGKLGGIELGYGSDLDLVFLYDTPDGNAMTSGSTPISSAQFYGRLGLKIRHILDTKLLSGILYEIDMRLRPNGDSGLLVSQIDSYNDYQHRQAWTWEHQALVRGRFIAGDPDLKTRFEQIRRNILCLTRHQDTLRQEVRDMREKMRDALDTKASGQFDLKQGKGGIADIEFLVQFLILANAEKFNELTEFSDNVRQLEALARYGILSQSEAETLKTAFCTYRDIGHKQVLQGDKALIDVEEVSGLREKVEGIWDRVVNDNREF
jgi:glutamate-ammonia-ligase adenylyltransferase